MVFLLPGRFYVRWERAGKPSPQGGPANRHDPAGEDLWSPCTYAYSDLAVDEISSLGFSAADLLASVGGERAETLTWIEGGATVGLAFEVLYAGGHVRLVDATPKEPGDDTSAPEDTGGPAEDECPDAITVEAALRFVTDDGGFAETIPVTLHAGSADGATLAGDVLVEDLEGTWTSDEYDPSEWEDLTVSVDASVEATSSSGELLLSGSQVLEEGDDVDTGVAFQGILAVWPPEAVEAYR
jgi:hypothetical protein